MLQERTKGIATDILMLKLERKQEVQNKKKLILHIKQQMSWNKENYSNGNNLQSTR